MSNANPQLETGTENKENVDQASQQRSEKSAEPSSGGAINAAAGILHGNVDKATLAEAASQAKESLSTAAQVGKLGALSAATYAATKVNELASAAQQKDASERSILDKAATVVQQGLDTISKAKNVVVEEYEKAKAESAAAASGGARSEDAGAEETKQDSGIAKEQQQQPQQGDREKELEATALGATEDYPSKDQLAEPPAKISKTSFDQTAAEQSHGALSQEQELQQQQAESKESSQASASSPEKTADTIENQRSTKTSSRRRTHA